MSGIRDAEAAVGALPLVVPPQYHQTEAAAVQTLPRDHPHWIRDTISISSRARSLLQRVRPVLVRVLGFWDHALRSIAIGEQRLSVDPAGSYRLD